jgi:hypothetical protein
LDYEAIIEISPGNEPVGVLAEAGSTAPVVGCGIRHLATPVKVKPGGLTIDAESMVLHDQ